MVERMLQKPSPAYLRFPCVTPSWDNTARRKQGATIFHGSTPEKYELWLRSVLQETVTNPSQKGIVFINAWNEWAEGNHLEPFQRWGHGYLEATRRALKSIS
ncbi:MAG: hypothetical protein GC195_05335 [Nostoc sp. RI_552]|nr:hypothetical protein [Nostoc sp. RI_552]